MTVELVTVVTRVTASSLDPTAGGTEWLAASGGAWAARRAGAH